MIPAAVRRFATLALGIPLSAAHAAAQPAPEPGALPPVAVWVAIPIRDNP